MRRGVAALALFVFGLANLASLEHEATAHHVRCAEHGELLEGVTGGAARNPTATLSASDIAEGHAHCAFHALLTQSATGAPTQLAVAPFVAQPTLLPDLPPAPPAPVAVYRLAPKTSPPV